MVTKMFVCELLFVAGFLLQTTYSQSKFCSWTPWSNLKDPPCPKKFDVAIYTEGPSGNQHSTFCCDERFTNVTSHKEATMDCRATPCLPISSSKGDLCSNLEPRRFNNQTIQYEETIRDDCALGLGEDISGVAGLCCPIGSVDSALTAWLGVENHEFPHFARLISPKSNGSSSCGGSVYNEKYIITAAHCVFDAKRLNRSTEVKVILESEIAEGSSRDVFTVASVIIHQNYSNNLLLNDIALVELSKNIDFKNRKYIRAIPIAQTGFDPLKYASQAVIVGFGRTNTLRSSKKLQKANTKLRNGTVHVSEGGRYPWYANYIDQLVFAGGFENGVGSAATNKGDSGGPLICRDKNGFAVLCGITSFGSNETVVNSCMVSPNQENCIPAGFANVGYFNSWIVENAGGQKNASVMKRALYGGTIEDSLYNSQIMIYNNVTRQRCGGTLIKNNMLLTATHCVNQHKKDLYFVYNGNEFLTHESIQEYPGFKEVSFNGGKTKRLASFGALTFSTYYENDLSLVKLATKTSIADDVLPKIAKYDHPKQTSFWGVEVAFQTDRKGMSQRSFKIIHPQDCQARFDLLGQKLDKEILCGVEKYSGGSIQDRTLGGGLFCENLEREYELCGVQAYRGSNFAIPNGFVDMRRYHEWVQQTLLLL